MYIFWVAVSKSVISSTCTPSAFLVNREKTLQIAKNDVKITVKNSEKMYVHVLNKSIKVLNKPQVTTQSH